MSRTWTCNSRKIWAAPAAALLLAIPAPGAASGPGYTSRALPAFLALDETVLPQFPGGAAGLSRKILIQHGSSLSGYRTGIGTYPVSLGIATPFGWASGGGSLRYAAYFDDGAYGALLATPGGLGFTVSYFENRSKEESLTYRFIENGQDDEQFSIGATESGRREVRLGSGWQTATSGGRVWELGVGLAWVDVRRSSSMLNNLEPVYETGWESDLGFRADVAVRTLNPSRGIQAAARYMIEDRDPRSASMLLPSRERTTVGSLDLGWRQPVATLNDLVIGLSGRWLDSKTGTVVAFYSYHEHSQENAKQALLGAFVSLEKTIVSALVFRGGLVGSGNWTDQERFALRIYDDRSEERGVGSHEKSWRTNTPEARLGLGWTVQEFTGDFQLDVRLDLDSIVVAWAIAHPL